MIKRITDKIHWVGVNDYISTVFESIWPIPEGISYNSYLLADGETVLFDTVKEPWFGQFLDNIKAVIGGRPVNNLVVHHLEPDHAGSIKLLRQLYPDMKITGNAKTVEFLNHIFPDVGNVQQVNDGDTIKIGSHTLKFCLTPMLHWPETMMSFEQSTGTLFSGDAFGAFKAIDGALFDGQNDIAGYEENLLRYYSNIIGKYSGMVQKALVKLDGMGIKTICPSHGIIWRENPTFVIDKYRQWSSQSGEKGVAVVYGSMYGNTEKMVEAVSGALCENGAGVVKIYNVAKTHVSYIVSDIWRYRGLILASPTYDTKVFPLMDNLLNLLRGKMIKNKVLGIFGTYGWSGGAVGGIRQFAEDCKLEVIEPVIEARFTPKESDLRQCEELGRTMAQTLLRKS